MNVNRRVDAEATREALLDAAEAVFYERGVARASLEAIARRAGLTRGALYWHFDGKADLFRQLLERVRMPYEELVREIPADQRTTSRLDEIRLACLQALERLGQPRYRRIHSILLHRCEFFDDINPTGLMAQMSRQGIESTKERFEQAADNGELRDGLDPETANLMLHNLLRGIFHGWHLDPGAFALRETGRRLINEWFVLVRAD